MGDHFCVVYDMGPHDSIEEEGSKMKCDQYVNACQNAYDKPLRIVPMSQVRQMSLYMSEFVTGYQIE